MQHGFKAEQTNYQPETKSHEFDPKAFLLDSWKLPKQKATSFRRRNYQAKQRLPLTLQPLPAFELVKAIGNTFVELLEKHQTENE